mgnify:CR=1 FL=1
MRDNFDAILAKYPEVLIFGEDAGHIGDVNQGLEGLQEKFGEMRVSDTGIGVEFDQESLTDQLFTIRSILKML